jgi:hypothetical protein
MEEARSVNASALCTGEARILCVALSQERSDLKEPPPRGNIHHAVWRK